MTIAAAPALETVVVGMGEMRVSRSPGAALTCLGLGSCIALCLYDPLARAGGMAHIVLPSSAGRGGEPSPRYADTAVALLLEEMARQGAVARRLVAKIAGGAQMSLAPGLDGVFKMGERNAAATREALAAAGLRLAGHDTGGHKGRTVRLFVGSGLVVVTTAGRESRGV